MKKFQRILIACVALLLVTAQLAFAATPVDGNWYAKVKGSLGTASTTVPIYLTLDNGKVRARGGEVITRTGTYQIVGNKLIFSASVFGVNKTPEVKYVLNAKKKTLTLSGMWYFIPGKATFTKMVATVNKVGYVKPKVGKASNVYVYGNGAAEYAVLLDRTLRVIAIVDGKSGGRFTFPNVTGWRKGTNYLYAYTGIKSVNGAIPITAQVGELLSAADKAKLSKVRKVTIKKVK